jgi:hypothetical protein
MGSKHDLLMTLPMPLYCHRAGWSVENINWSVDPVLIPRVFPRPSDSVAGDTIEGKEEGMDVVVKSGKDEVHTSEFFFLEFIRTLYNIFGTIFLL